MNNSTPAVLCDTADYLAHSTQLRVMMSIRLVVAVVGLVLFIVLFKVQGTYMAFHANARVLFISHHVWVILQALANIFCYTVTLIQFTPIYANPCDYLLTAVTSVLVRAPTILTIYGQVWALSTMAVERCVATYKYRDYEKSTNRMGKFFILAQWLLAILWLYIILSRFNFKDLKVYPSISSETNSSAISTLLFVLAGVETISLCTFLTLFWYNRRKSKRLSDASLTEKYQVDENIRAITLMIPMVLTHFCSCMPTLITVPVYMKFIDATLNQRYYTVYVETVNSSLLYCVFLPIVLFWRHKVLRQNLRRVLGRNVIAPDAPSNEQYLRHFEILKQMWKDSSV